MRTILMTVLCLTFALANNYEGFKVYNIYPDNIQQVNFLKGLEEGLNIDYWTISKVPNTPVVALLAPENQYKFQIQLWLANIKWSILIEDVAAVMEREQMQQRLAPPLDVGKITFNQYHSFADIKAYLDQLEVDHAGIATLETIGQTSSVTQNDILMVNICTGACGTNPKIFIECGIHAREWIAPAVCLYIIQELVENPSGNAENAALIDNVDWHIVPLLNVDGYEYSHGINSRLWRKTRKVNPGSPCVGVDANRNFEFQWTAGGSECSETYPGDVANVREAEVKAIQDKVRSLNIGTSDPKQIKLYLAMHSYGQYILHPWSYKTTTDPPSPEEEKFKEFGERVAKAIQEFSGTRYVVGSFHDALYEAVGTSLDWAEDQGIGLAYTIELPGGGNAGFDLPEDQIERVAVETFEGIKEFHKIIEELLVLP